MLKSIYPRILIGVALSSMSLIAGSAQPQREGNKQPIHKEALIKALKQLHRGDSQVEIVSQIRLRGVDFEMTPAIEKELRGAGASSEMIETIRANYRLPVLPKAAANEIAFWNSIKDSANPDDYRAYLKKYPDGQFAQDAQNQVNSLEAAANENAAWNSIKDSTNPDDYRAYLNNYPNAMHGDSARNQIEALDRAAREEAARKEDARKKEEEAKKEEARRKEAEEKKRAGTIVRNQIGMELVYVSAGTFMMGSDDNYSSGQKPAHRVTIRNGFYMGKYEVTQAEWQKVMASNPSKFKGQNVPVESVTWIKAQEFLQKLNQMNDGYIYRLPTEAEWEYACRAGTTTRFAFGDSISFKQANVASLTYGNGESKEAAQRKPARVGNFQPNAFGLYDMHGNVAEWCQDWYDENYYSNSPSTDPQGPTNGQTRVIRGGSYDETDGHSRSTVRDSSAPEDATYWAVNTGFRVVAVLRSQ